MVWGGATFDAIRRINQMQHARSGFRRVRLSQRDYREAAEAEYVNEYVSFECFMMCGNCGYLAEPSSEAKAFECPACDARSGLDLMHIDVADELRKADEMSRLHPTPRVADEAFGIATVIGLCTALAFVLYKSDALRSVSGHGDGGYLVLGTMALFLVVGGGSAFLVHRVFAKRLHRALHEREGRRPARWRLPLPLVNDKLGPIRKIEASIEVDGPLLRAPVSGRECVGYEVAVLFDVADDIAKPLWVLEEESCAAFRLGQESFEADSITLILPLQPVEAPTTDQDVERLTRFLRRRGLFMPDGHFAFFEALLLPGQTCTARLHAGRRGQAWVLGDNRHAGYEAGPETTLETIA